MTAIREMHGMSLGSTGKRTPLHRLWLNMRNRCNNPKTASYRYYGGRGIKVCARWDRFVNFAADVGEHPGSGWTLDRIETDGDYEPGNVRWATRTTQARNRNYNRVSHTTVVEIREAYAAGARQVDLAAKYGASQTTISAIVRGKTWA